MADADLQLKALEALVRIRRSIENVQLYPPVDSIVTDFFEMIYFHLMETLRQNDPSAFAEFEQKVLSLENISDQQGGETIHISSLLDILPALGVRNISFNKNPEKEELHIFINLYAKRQDALRVEDMLHDLTGEKAAISAEPERQESVAPEKEQEIITVPDIDLKATAGLETNKEEYITLEKEQEIISESDIISEPVISNEPDGKEYVSAEKEQPVPFEPDSRDNQLSRNVGELEKVFTRLNAMDGDISSLPTAEKMEEIRKISLQVAEWLEKEEDCSLEYKEICRRLETILQESIENGFFAETTPIINAFSKINDGLLQKDDQIKEISLKVLRNLSSDSNVNILFKEINTNDNNKKDEACQVFAGFGSVVINKLLDGLKKASDSKARVSIIHVIEEMGSVAIPAIKASIDMNAPWYYLRNMAYVLGRIGNERSIEILKPLLLHKEKRVRKEAFKSICQTGGNMRGSLFLSVLSHVDKELRIDVIGMLGKIKYAEAVTDLQYMLKSKYNTMAKNDQISLQEEICNALGAIGSPAAVKTLTEIAETKSILGMGSYPKEVKNAAERALSYIKRRG